MNHVNKAIEKHLQKWIDQGRVPNSLLFAGPAHSPKDKFALKFAYQLMGVSSDVKNHPDLYQYTPEGKLGLHSMETMRTLSEEVYKRPFQAPCKVFIIFSADRMQTAPANALLKTFEEPLSSSRIILVSSHPEKLLPTVRSRCQSVYFQGESEVSPEFWPILEPILSHVMSLSPAVLVERVGSLTSLLEKSAAIDSVLEGQDETAYQKMMREKEEEGRGSLQLAAVTDMLWEAILSWYRDIHALHFSLPSNLLLQPSLQKALQNQVDSGFIADLDLVQKKVECAKIAFSRSMPLKHVLESLFLSLR